MAATGTSQAAARNHLGLAIGGRGLGTCHPCCPLGTSNWNRLEAGQLDRRQDGSTASCSLKYYNTSPEVKRFWQVYQKMMVVFSGQSRGVNKADIRVTGDVNPDCLVRLG